VPTNEFVRKFIQERVSIIGCFCCILLVFILSTLGNLYYTENGELCRTKVGGAAVGDCIERSKSDNIKWPDSCSKISICNILSIK
jgi:hypothetical protein